MNRTRVVITGMGVTSSLGDTVDSFWDGLVAGRSGIRPITHFDASKLPSRIAGLIPDFDPEAHLERKEARRMPRSAQLATVAAMRAWADAGLDRSQPDPERAAVVFGTGIGGIERFHEGVDTYHSEGYYRVNPFTVPGGIPNMSAFQISRYLQCLGPNSTITTACAAGTQAIGEATELIRRCAADIVVTGGTESALTDYTLAGFCAMRALAVNYNDNPQAASRPFDAKREGFVFAEGAGVLILERLEHALARGVPIYAEVLGQSSSADGYNIVVPHPEATGPIRAMKWALSDAGIQPSQVDYINAHGTSTVLNDPNETRAIRAVFNEIADRIPISSTKSMLGHTMGASGALEAIASVQTIRHNLIHPTINQEYPDPECDLDYVPNVARKQEVNIVLSNSFGFGGQNACLVITGYP